jgi:hypothetical protein
MKTTIPLFLTLLAFLWVAAVASNARAVNPPPDGGYPGGNTAEGQNALLSLTTGSFNTAVGWFSLRSDIDGGFNTAVGAGTLVLNSGPENTAVGTAALLLNSTGGSNTAFGTFALANNDSDGAHFGNANTAVGAGALFSNIDGASNNAVGFNALSSNSDGAFNSVMGSNVMADNVSGSGNVAIGDLAGAGVEGDFNIYIGAFAGPGPSPAPVPESETIRIGDVFNVACFIGGISGVAVTGDPVVVDANGQLGVAASSRRFKKEIEPMAQTSEAILALKPVTFHYKKEIDPPGRSQFGLVAEDVEKVNPDLVVRDKEGKPYSVRYDQVNAMLLNEFLKQHRKVENLEATVAQQQKSFQSKLAEQEKRIEALTSGLERVSARLEVSEPQSQTVLNNSQSDW